MNKIITLALIFSSTLFFAHCKKESNNPTKNENTNAPVSVTKTVTKKVYVHVMPWFETNTSNPASTSWGQHWTMSTRNPDIVDADGKREIASYFYPQIGPYASGDSKVIEYQLLLMKLSGIDGVLIDWPGTVDLYDYSRNKSNAEAMIAMLSKVGLKYAIVYEDNNIKTAAQNGVITDKIAAAQSDIDYAQSYYFSDTSYIYVNNQPLLLVFGPQTFTTGSEWTQIFSDLSVKPAFLTLWDQASEVGSNCGGEFSWVYQDDNTSHIQCLTRFYNRTISGIKMGSAYPGFKDYYSAGGWGSSYFVIPHNNLSTFSTTLDMALNSNSSIIQLITWNDYGEGTMIEPTDEFGYGFLTTLQQKLGVSYTESELKLVTNLYKARCKYIDTESQKKLDEAFYDIVQLKITDAQTIINGFAL